jgi:hypothetical protein
MTFKVVHVRHRAGAPTKPILDLTKAAPRPIKVLSAKPNAPEKPKPEAKEDKPAPLYIPAAPDGPPIAADLSEGHRKIKGGPLQNPLTDKQVEILDRVIRAAGNGDPKTLGLRLVLSASEDEHAAAWPIGLLSKGLRLSGRPIEGDAVHKVAMGCRTSRYRDMAANALVLLNEKIEAAKAVPSA